MKHVSNVDKAIEISNAPADYQAVFDSKTMIRLQRYNAAMLMAQWKDEQFTEKCKYFLDHTCFGGYYNRRGILDVDKLFDDLIKFIKEEQP